MKRPPSAHRRCSSPSVRGESTAGRDEVRRGPAQSGVRPFSRGGPDLAQSPSNTRAHPSEPAAKDDPRTLRVKGWVTCSRHEETLTTRARLCTLGREGPLRGRKPTGAPNPKPGPRVLGRPAPFYPRWAQGIGSLAPLRPSRPALRPNPRAA